MKMNLSGDFPSAGIFLFEMKMALAGLWVELLLTLSSFFLLLVRLSSSP
jgi:hypothetical protein